MKRSLLPYILATSVALLALLVSQGIWISNASKQASTDQELEFQTCFNQSVSAHVNELMGRDVTDYPYKIVPLDEEGEGTGENTITLEQKEKAIDAGNLTEGMNASVLIENALIVLRIRDNTFHLSRLDTLITACIQKDNRVVSSKLSLIELKADQMLDETERDFGVSNKSFFVKTHTAERKIEIPEHTYLIRAQYTLKQPGYLQTMGVTTLVSLVASVVIISVLIFLLFILMRRNQENLNMQRSFHGAIHDLKSPLAFAFFTLSTMEEEETDMRKKASLATASERVSYLTDKIMQLLKSGRKTDKIADTDKQIVYLYDVLEQIEAEMRALFPEKKIGFAHLMDAELSVRVLPDLFEASMRTIIENGVKYSGSEPEIIVSAEKGADKTRITIADNGAGIAKEQMKNIFKPYYTSDNKNGTGIGLHYARSIIQAHGGSIVAESLLGKGSSFTLTIPN